MQDIGDEDTLWQLGNWIARWRAATGVSQRRLARMAGISQGGLSRVERGLQACGARRLARLIVSLDALSGQSSMGRPVQPPSIRDTGGRGAPEEQPIGQELPLPPW